MSTPITKHNYEKVSGRRRAGELLTQEYYPYRTGKIDSFPADNMKLLYLLLLRLLLL